MKNKKIETLEMDIALAMMIFDDLVNNDFRDESEEEMMNFTLTHMWELLNELFDEEDRLVGLN